MGWAAAECRDLDPGDKRRDARAARLAERLWQTGRRQAPARSAVIRVPSSG